MRTANAKHELGAALDSVSTAVRSLQRLCSELAFIGAPGRDVVRAGNVTARLIALQAEIRELRDEFNARAG